MKTYQLMNLQETTRGILRRINEVGEKWCISRWSAKMNSSRLNRYKKWNSHIKWLSNKHRVSRVYWRTGDTSFGKTEEDQPSLFKERDGGFALCQMEFDVPQQQWSESAKFWTISRLSEDRDGWWTFQGLLYFCKKRRSHAIWIHGTLCVNG